MSTQGQQSPVASPIYRTERVIASLVMAWVIILTTYMIFQDHALSHASMYFLKIILSLSGAVMLATLPGFMDVNYTIGGFSVRAAGGAAAFVFIYTQSPNLPALKLDPAEAKPAQHQPVRKSDNLSQLSNGLPMLMAFSLIAPDLLFSFGPSDKANSRSGGFEAGVEINPPQSDPLSGAAPGGIGLGEAVRGDAAAVVVTIASYARAAGRELLMLLDTAAAALRGGVSKLADTVGNLLEVAKMLGGVPPQGIALVSQNLTARTDELVSSIVGIEGAPTDSLFTLFDGLTIGLSGDSQNPVGGIVATVGGTVEGLTSLVQGSVHTLLDCTGTLAHGVTGLLDGATGGLTAGLTPAANELVSGLASATGRVVDGITPVVAKTAGQLMDGVGDGVGQLTERLNAVSPTLLNAIDQDFLAGHSLIAAPNPLETTASLPRLDKLGGTLDKLRVNDHGLLAGGGLLGRGGERNSLASKFNDPLGGEALPTGPVCIGGCGGTLLSGVGGALSGTVGGLGAGQGRLLGSLNGGGAAAGPALGGASGGLLSGGNLGASPAAGLGRAGAPGGAISSTVGTTRSILGGVTRGLGRR